MQQDETFGIGLEAGAPHYRAFVGPPDRYDLVAAMQFDLLTHFGLRDYHSLLDIGCGSLRFGRLAIPYLRPERYFGIEPSQWLIDEGIEKECGRDLIRIKKPRFSGSARFELTEFGVIFDYLLAQSIFSHASQAQIKKCMSEAAKCMHEESKFLATYVQGEVDYEGQQWLYPGCCPTMIGLADTHGLDCTPLDWEHPNGQRWLLLKKQPFDAEV